MTNYYRIGTFPVRPSFLHALQKHDEDILRSDKTRISESISKLCRYELLCTLCLMFVWFSDGSSPFFSLSRLSQSFPNFRVLCSITTVRTHFICTGGIIKWKMCTMTTKNDVYTCNLPEKCEQLLGCKSIHAWRLMYMQYYQCTLSNKLEKKKPLNDFKLCMTSGRDGYN